MKKKLLSTKFKFLYFILFIVFLCFGNFKNVDELKTFSVMGKQSKLLWDRKEKILLKKEGKGVLHHMWFGGQVVGVVIKVYVDGEEKPSIEMDMHLGHSTGFKNKDKWGVGRVGKIGPKGGIYNTFQIPYRKQIVVTAQECKSKGKQQFWWILRGTENLPLVVNGIQLPKNTKLVLHKLEKFIGEPYQEFDICNVKGKGLLYHMFMESENVDPKGGWKNASFLEAVIRAYDNNGNLDNLSSGLEDYFLGTYYFNTGKFQNELAGVTHITKHMQYAMYRSHEIDPYYFQNGMRLTCRVGDVLPPEEGDVNYKIDPNNNDRRSNFPAIDAEKGEKLHRADKSQFTVYTWVYEW